MCDGVAYKILSQDEFAAFQRDGVFTGSAADRADGFIHLSAGSQVAGTVERYYRDRTDLVLAAVDLTKLGDAVRWEPASNGALYPHVYGVVPMTAVMGAGPLEPAP
jgi:uncharacterized protein (DUF952 family)